MFQSPGGWFIWLNLGRSLKATCAGVDRVQSLRLPCGMNGWRVQWLSKLWDASSSTSIPLPTTEEARAGGGTRAMSVALMLSELGIRAGLALPSSLGPTSPPQTCQASEKGVGQSCRLEKTSASSLTRGSPVQSTQDSRWAVTGGRQCPAVKRNPLVDSLYSR